MTNIEPLSIVVQESRQNQRSEAMHLPEFESRYWKSADVKILLANMAKQKELGLLSDADIKLFSEHLAATGTDGSTATRVLSSSTRTVGKYSLEDFFFKASIHPDSISGQLLIRVAPLSAILASIDLGGREASLQAQLQIFSDTSSDPSESDRAERRLTNAFKVASFKSFAGIWDAKLEAFCEMALEAEFAKDKGIGLMASRIETPKFVSYLTDRHGDENPNLQILKHSGTKSRGPGVADDARDILGLDHLTKTYKKKRTILGFLIFRADDLTAHRIKRPTVFDETSSLRFRGICSQDALSLQQWGQTADLMKLHEAYKKGTTPEIEGSPEVVMNNPSLLPGAKVLVGYLGPLSLPRDDTNDLDPVSQPDACRTMQEISELFLHKYIGGGNAANVHAALF